MNPADEPSLPLSMARRIDAICDAFETAWNSGQRPDLREFLCGDTDQERTALQRELILMEIDCRRRRGESPSVGEYMVRFPDLEPSWLVEAVETQESNPAVEATIGTATEVASTHLGNIRYFGDYELLEEIARGGMGVVYKARQISLGRIVAIKRMLSGQLASPSEVARFVQEAKMAAQLDHPNIVPLYEIGEHQCDRYISMGFVEGHTIDRHFIGELLEPREVARIMADVAAAIQYAHDKGVIHRDLKPTNILLDRNGHPRITDFGLAKRVGDDVNLTTTGQVMGTPSYMPPEQAAGNLDAIGRHSDIYSLGAVLYVLLTGRPPFKAASALQTLSQVLEREPANLRALNASIPRDLETITLKCLEKSIPRRYSSAQHLADELQRFLEGRPIIARPIGVWDRGWRWCRRNPAIATLVTLLILTLVAGTAVSSRFAWQENQRAIAESAARLDEQKARAEAERQRDIAQAFNEIVTRDILGQTDIWVQAETQSTVNPDITVKATLDGAAEKIGERFPGRPDLEAAVRRSLGAAFSALGEHAKGIVQLERAVAIWKSLETVDKYELYGAQYQLGKVYYLSGRREDAIATLRSCAEQTKKEIGRDAREALQVEMSLATILLGSGDESLKILEELEPIVLRTLNLDESDSLHFQNVLGMARQQANKMPEALATFTTAHARSRRRFGDKNPLTMMLLNNRARWYLVNGQPAEAIVLFDELEPVVASQLGPDNQLTLMTRGNLAFCCLEVGDAARAARIMEGVVRQMKQVPGATHPHSRMAMVALARAWRLLNRLDDAAAQYEELLTLSSSGPGSPDVMPPRIVWLLAAIYAEQGKQMQLATLVHTYLGYLASNPGINEQNLASELFEAGRYLLIAEEWSAAESALHRSLELRGRLEPDVWTTFLTQSLLGYSLLMQARSDEAASLMNAGYAGLQLHRVEIPATAKPRMMELFGHFVQLYQQRKQDDLVEEWRAKLERAQSAEGIELP